MESLKTTDFSDEKRQERSWKRLSEWIHCICVVTFDLELGQAMEVCRNKLNEHHLCRFHSRFFPYKEYNDFEFQLKQEWIIFQAVYPSNVELSEKEKLNICYLAFPDSNSGCMGDTQFHIRLRVAPGKKHTLLNAELQRFSLQCVTVQRPDLGHYWGYVYFRQTKDATLPRGYFQKVCSFN